MFENQHDIHTHVHTFAHIYTQKYTHVYTQSHRYWPECRYHFSTQNIFYCGNVEPFMTWRKGGHAEKWHRGKLNKYLTTDFGHASNFFENPTANLSKKCWVKMIFSVGLF